MTHFDFPDGLMAVMEERAKALGFASLEEYVANLVRNDILRNPCHELIKPYSDLSDEDAKSLDARLLEKVRTANERTQN